MLKLCKLFLLCHCLDCANTTLHRPEATGVIAACVYLFVLIAFRPFCFYKDIVAVTSGNGHGDITLKLEEAETGRSLHRFPYSKVSNPGCTAVMRRIVLVLHMSTL